MLGVPPMIDDLDDRHFESRHEPEPIPVFEDELATGDTWVSLGDAAERIVQQLVRRRTGGVQ